jgi:hypothetical protein
MVIGAHQYIQSPLNATYEILSFSKMLRCIIKMSFSMESNCTTGKSLTLEAKIRPTRFLTRGRINSVVSALNKDHDSSKIIARRISREKFLEFIQNPDNDDLEKDIRMSFVTTDGIDCKMDSEVYGNILLIELTESQVHSRTKTQLTNQIVSQHGLAAYLCTQPEFRCDFAGIISKRSDNSIFPFRGGNTWPTLVVEVAYKHEDYETLQSELLEWISSCTEVEIAIGIKIDDFRRFSTGEYAGHVRMRALLYRKNQVRNNVRINPTRNGLNAWYDPELLIEFGTDVVQTGLMFSFPVAYLFVYMRNPLALAVQNLIGNNAQITIDLDHLRDVIIDNLV